MRRIFIDCQCCIRRKISDTTRPVIRRRNAINPPGNRPALLKLFEQADADPELRMTFWFQRWSLAGLFTSQMLWWMQSILATRFANVDPAFTHHVLAVGHHPLIGLPYTQAQTIPASWPNATIFSYHWHIPPVGPPHRVPAPDGNVFTPYEP